MIVRLVQPAAYHRVPKRHGSRPGAHAHRLGRRQSGQRRQSGCSRKKSCCRNMASSRRSSAISASPIVLQALLAGEIDVSAISVTTLVSSRLAGADTVMILGMVRTFVDHILAQQSITSIEQLKGKIGGVNRIGSTSDMGLRLALRRLEYRSGKRHQIITAGGNPERFAALIKGRDQFHHHARTVCAPGLAAGLSPSIRYRFVEDTVLVERVLTREAIVKAKRPLLLKFTRAMIEAIHFNKTHKEESKAIWGKYLTHLGPRGPRARLADLYGGLSRTICCRRPKA